MNKHFCKKCNTKYIIDFKQTFKILRDNNIIIIRNENNFILTKGKIKLFLEYTLSCNKCGKYIDCIVDGYLLNLNIYDNKNKKNYIVKRYEEDFIYELTPIINQKINTLEKWNITTSKLSKIILNEFRRRKNCCIIV